MNTGKIHGFFFGSLRRQLIIGMAAVYALAMALFIGDLTRRQAAYLLDRQAEQTIALAQTLATSSDDWLAAHDISGLQELVESQRRYPELQFAMVLDTKGQILAHTDRSRIGQYVKLLFRKQKVDQYAGLIACLIHPKAEEFLLSQFMYAFLAL